MAFATAQAYKDAKFVQYWLDQLDGYSQEFKRWEKRCERIVKRYRDERQEKSDGSPDYSTKFNALWSNVQTLSPAVYAKAPQPVVERRYLDKDPVARFASMTLERSLEVSIQECGYHPSIQRAVLDYLLCARGVVWDRYEPTYGKSDEEGEQSSEDESLQIGEVAEDDEDDDDKPEAPRPVTWEKVYTDYVGWKNFRHSTAPIWEEVRWVAKREYMTRREMRARWPKAKDPTNGRLIADIVPLQDQTFKDWDEGGKEKPKKSVQTAEVWEIWDKTNLEVVFIATAFPLAPLERVPDPLKLQSFWPCPKPLYATTTNDTLIPVPDYIEYQDQAEELDQLTARIKALTDAVRVNGVYDASIPELKRILQEGADNRLIGVAKWAEFSQKGGLEKSIDFVPLKDVVEALLRLYEARDKVKADMAEITGLSDIVRGQAQGAAKTATEQRIKGQFATLRLQDRQSEVARFCRDTLAISAEIIAEQFSEEILAEMTGMLSVISDELKSDQPQQQAPQPMPQPPMAGPPGAPPMAPGAPTPMPDPAQIQQMQMAQEQKLQQLSQQIFNQCCKLLRDDKMRTFRIDIETSSTIEIDRQAEKEAVTEMLTAMGNVLTEMVQVGQMIPEMVPALGQTFLFAFRRFGVGRDVEGAWEQAIDKLTQKAKNPPPPKPSPEEMKAQAEMAKQQQENQRMAAQAEIDQRNQASESAAMQQKQAFDMQMAQQEGQLKIQALAADNAFREREYALKERAMMLDIAAKERVAQINAATTEHKAGVQMQANQQQAALSESEHQRSMEAGEHSHKLQMETAEFKAKQAKKPKAKEPA